MNKGYSVSLLLSYYYMSTDVHVLQQNPV